MQKIFLDELVKGLAENIINIETATTWPPASSRYKGYPTTNTEKTILQHQLFKDRNTFRLSAEKKFRNKYKSQKNESINATLLFENNTFHCRKTYFIPIKDYFYFTIHTKPPPMPMERKNYCCP
jgi:hypothetical protein